MVLALNLFLTSTFLGRSTSVGEKGAPEPGMPSARPLRSRLRTAQAAGGAGGAEGAGGHHVCRRLSRNQQIWD